MPKRSVVLITFAFFLIAFSFINSAAGQLRSRVAKPLLECSITIDSKSINRNHPAIVSVTIENVSGGELDLKAVYSFELLTISPKAIARDFQVVGDSYWSPLDISSSESLKLPVNGRVPKLLLHLKRDEVKGLRFDLAKLSWNASMLSIWPHENLFDVVPKGSYWLVFKLSGNRETISNKIEVLVE